jgi:hypothetical protein
MKSYANYLPTWLKIPRYTYDTVVRHFVILYVKDTSIRTANTRRKEVYRNRFYLETKKGLYSLEARIQELSTERASAFLPFSSPLTVKYLITASSIPSRSQQLHPLPSTLPACPAQHVVRSLRFALQASYRVAGYNGPVIPIHSIKRKTFQ